jgi:hypothetical protein
MMYILTCYFIGRTSICHKEKTDTLFDIIIGAEVREQKLKEECFSSLVTRMQMRSY